MEKKDRKEIFDLFVQAFKGKEFKVLSGLNPCIIEYAGTRFNVYIKNLTPAQLSNNNHDIWRCQLPKRSIFDKFKSSKDFFLFLGYDASNDVYTTWNPYWAKQRLNVADNISMYSRYSVQKEACETSQIIQHDLKHKGIVVIMPRLLLTNYIDHISEYFEKESKYEAIGSRLKKNKDKMNYVEEEPYLIFTNKKNIDSFKEYLSHLSLSQSTQNKYLSCVKLVFKENYHTKYKSLFLKYNTLSQYTKAIDEFCNTEDIAILDRRCKNGHFGFIRAGLKCYLNSLITPQTNKRENKDLKINSLTKHCSSDVLKNIADLMCMEEPKEMEAMQVLYEDIGDMYNQSISLADWIQLLRSTDWTKFK